MFYVPRIVRRENNCSSYASLRLFMVLVLAVAGGSRPKNVTDEIFTTIIPTTDLNVVDKMIDIFVTKDDNLTTRPQDHLRVLSNIVQIEFENETPVHISNEFNKSEPVVVVRDSPPIQARQILISPFLIITSLISLTFNFLALIFTLIMYTKYPRFVRYPVSQKESHIYVAPTQSYNESQSLTSSCE